MFIFYVDLVFLLIRFGDEYLYYCVDQFAYFLSFVLSKKLIDVFLVLIYLF